METFLSPVIQKLLELLAEEVNLLKGVHKEVKSLKDELEVIQPFLRDAEAKTEKGEVSEATKVWLKQLREEADRIEDVIDEYTYQKEQCRHQCAFNSFHHKVGHFIKALKPNHNIASKLRDIDESLRKIKDRGAGYGLRPLEQGSGSIATHVERHDPRLGSLFMEEDEIIGIDDASKELLGWLIGGASMRSVISLVGQGGIGKTTLARKVYNDEVMKRHFDCRAWITVSQSYNAKKLLRIVSRQICFLGGSIEEDCTLDELISPLRQFLQTKRYVIVFDDVWQKDFWEVIKYAFPNNDKGSRIIITTRNTAIATSCKENSCDLIHELQTWSSEMAWELFCKKAFRNNEFEGHCPQELEQLSREIISKCQGLPLVISTIAGLLSTKEKVYFEWRNVLINLSSQYEKTDVPKILSLSYLDLPYHLKSCFLYFGIFPEDYRIYGTKLYRLWIAEGLVKARKNKTLEEVAEEYLNELIQRNLVLFEIQFGFDRICRVHDLMHDIIVAISGESRFCQTLNESKSCLVEKSHRLSIYDSTENVLKAVGDSKIRSIFLVDINDSSMSVLVGLFKCLKLLKVLDFTNAPLDNIPKEIGNLFHLRYLCLRGTKVKRLPRSIGKLHGLQTLDIKNTLVRELPIEINELTNLRHLLANTFDEENGYSLDSYCGVKIHEGIGRLEELQTLTRVEVHFGGAGIVKELQKLRKLKCLGVSKLTTEVGRVLGAAIEKMNLLEMLFLTSINEDEVLDLRNISSPPPFLCYLQLNCRLQELPNWISKLHNLRGLDLFFSRLVDEPLKYLSCLPNLAYLDMYQTYDGEELQFEEGGFHKLRELGLRKLEGLKVMKINKGALPVLEALKFGPCPLMKEMPSGIQHLTNLKSLEIRDMPKEFAADLQADGGPYHVKFNIYRSSPTSFLAASSIAS